MKIPRILGALAAATLLVASAAIPANAATVTPTKAPEAVASSQSDTPTIDPRIVGGNTVPISAAPYAAQTQMSGTFGCTGSIIAPQWVMTAKHCLSSNMSVRLGSAQLGQGTQIAVTETVQWSGGDILLLKLAEPYQTTFGVITKNPIATGSTGSIFGWGRETANGPAAANLKSANVQYTNNSTDAYGGPAYQHSGINGQAWKGDSGGPFVVGGKIAGVCSTGTSGGTNPNGIANYTNVSAAASWIESVTGVTAR